MSASSSSLSSHRTSTDGPGMDSTTTVTTTTTKTITTRLEQPNQVLYMLDLGFGSSTCAACGKESDPDNFIFLVFQCARCKLANYCSKKCYNKNLPVHQKYCRKSGALETTVPTITAHKLVLCSAASSTTIATTSDSLEYQATKFSALETAAPPVMTRSKLSTTTMTSATVASIATSLSYSKDLDAVEIVQEEEEAGSLVVPEPRTATTSTIIAQDEDDEADASFSSLSLTDCRDIPEEVVVFSGHDDAAKKPTSGSEDDAATVTSTERDLLHDSFVLLVKEVTEEEEEGIAQGPVARHTPLLLSIHSIEYVHEEDDDKQEPIRLAVCTDEEEDDEDDLSVTFHYDYGEVVEAVVRHGGSLNTFTAEARGGTSSSVHVNKPFATATPFEVASDRSWRDIPEWTQPEPMQECILLRPIPEEKPREYSWERPSWAVNSPLRRSKLGVDLRRDRQQMANEEEPEASLEGEIRSSSWHCSSTTEQPKDVLEEARKELQSKTLHGSHLHKQPSDWAAATRMMRPRAMRFNAHRGRRPSISLGVKSKCPCL